MLATLMAAFIIFFVFKTGLVITYLPQIILFISWFNLKLDYMFSKFMKSIENNFDNPKVNNLLT